jgi:hypothetical protein
MARTANAAQYYVCESDADGTRVIVRPSNDVVVTRDADRELVMFANRELYTLFADLWTLYDVGQTWSLSFYQCPWEKVDQIVEAVPAHLRGRLNLRTTPLHPDPCPICVAVLRIQLERVAEVLPVVGVPEIIVNEFVGQYMDAECPLLHSARLAL